MTVVPVQGQAMENLVNFFDKALVLSKKLTAIDANSSWRC